jgi:hypothetical protein
MIICALVDNLQDFGAHTNYCELALRELGYGEVFPHTGVATEYGNSSFEHLEYFLFALLNYTGTASIYSLYYQFLRY